MRFYDFAAAGSCTEDPIALGEVGRFVYDGRIAGIFQRQVVSGFVGANFGHDGV